MKHNDIVAGQKIYTPLSLKLYNFIVLSISNKFIWKCPSQRLLKHFFENTSANHLDIGVGTGYFLKKISEKNIIDRMALMDMNKHCIHSACQVLQGLKSECYEHNIFERFTQKINLFNSVSANYLLHCLPGSMKDKHVVIKNISGLLHPKGVFFGSTILGGNDSNNFFAKKLMKIYNKKKIFSNEKDTLEDLASILDLYFAHVEIQVEGCVAIFKGIKK